MNRRSFVRTTGTLGAGLAVAGPAVVRSQTSETTSDEIQVALIGAGLQGETLMSACFDTWEAERVRVVAVCDVWESLNLKRMVALLEKYGQTVNAYTDYRTLLANEKGLQAVIIATPDFCHAEQTIACLEAGLHVYCEAPLSNTLEQARKVVQAARSSGKKVQVGYQRRSNPKYIHCQDKLLRAARLLGRITAVNGQSNHSAQADLGWSRRLALSEQTLADFGYPSMQAFKNWRWYRELGGGPLLDYGSHQIDIYNWFLDTTPKSVTARGGTYFYDPETHQWFDTVMAILDYETRQGPLSAFYQVITSNGYGGRYEVFLGEHGSLEISESAARTGVYRDPKTSDWDRWVRLGFLTKPGEPTPDAAAEGTVQAKETQPPALYKIPVQLTDPYHTPHLSNFFDAIQGEAELTCPPAVAYTTLATTLAIAQSITSGQTVQIGKQELTV